MIWKFRLKEMFVYRTRLLFGISRAVAQFNMGESEALKMRRLFAADIELSSRSF